MRPFSFPAIGVDISDESFKYLRLENRQGRREVAFFGGHDLPKDTIESGEIKNSKALSDILKTVFKPYRSKYPYLILSLPEEKGFLRLVRMQRIPEAEVRQALEFQLEEHIPYPPAELIFDFRILPAPGPKQTPEMRLVVTAYPRAIVESYMKAVEDAGFTPVIFELESQAVARAVAPKGTAEALLVGDIGRTRTTFSIVYRGSVHFTSTIRLGGRDIDAVLTSALHVSESEAAEIKIGRGIDHASEEIIKSLTPALGVLKEEAERQIAFWDHRKEEGEPAITHVYLCGGDAHLKGLPEYLTGELGIPVERGRIWENLFDTKTYVPPMRAHTTLRYATAFGLAMRGDDDLFLDQETYS